MRKFALGLLCLAIVGACSKHDPILPGERTAIFDSGNIEIINDTVPQLPENLAQDADTECPYSQDTSNIIWHGDKKIFSGFPTSNSVKSNMRPVCYGKYVYAGLTTGELVKINPKNRQIAWIADIYKTSNLTGGASVLDIVAPIIVREKYVYAGGLGDAFCKINTATGAKKWCADIGTAHPFIIAGDAIFVVATDGYLYALRDADGAAYWRAKLDFADTPSYANKIVTVDRQKFNAETGDEIK